MTKRYKFHVTLLYFTRLTLLLTLCGLSSRKSIPEGLLLSGLVHEEARPCMLKLIQTN